MAIDGRTKEKSVLFVCVENACRSQMAEGFLNKLSSREFNAESAGTQPADSVHPNAIRAMEEIGIDIRPQRPKWLTREMTQKADRVITMGCGAGVCPAVFVEKVAEWALEDPTAGSIERFREVRDEIGRKVEALIEEMKAG